MRKKITSRDMFRTRVSAFTPVSTNFYLVPAYITTSPTNQQTCFYHSIFSLYSRTSCWHTPGALRTDTKISWPTLLRYPQVNDTTRRSPRERAYRKINLTARTKQARKRSPASKDDLTRRLVAPSDFLERMLHRRPSLRVLHLYRLPCI